MAHSFGENEISKYDKLYLKKAMELEQTQRICMLCVDIQVKPNPKDPSSPFGEMIAPRLDIIKVFEKTEDNKTQINIIWVCPLCHNTRLIEKFDTFDDLKIYLIDLTKKLKLSKTVYAIIDILQRKAYEQLPGYTATMVQQNITGRK